MGRIRNRDFERITEDRGRLHEVDSVLLEILARLVRIPFEFHSVSLSSSVQIGITLALSRAAWRQHTPAGREPAGRREPAQGVGSSALLAFVCAGSSAEAWRPSVCVLHNAPTGRAR